MTNRLCSICARKGSKGVINKSLRHFAGKPLIAHVLQIAKQSKLFDVIAVSSDCDEVLNVAQKWGADYIVERPFEMATDFAAKLPSIQHCAREVQRRANIMFSTFVDLSVTAPLMIPSDIIGAVSLLENSTAENVITGSIASNSPYFSMVEKKTDSAYVVVSKVPTSDVVRRQDAPICYNMNGAIYVWKAETFFEIDKIITDKTQLYEMPVERSIDIDTEFDLMLAKLIFENQKDEDLLKLKPIEVV